MLVDAEYQTRDNRRLAKLLSDAQLRYPSACVEDVEPSPARGIDKPMLRQTRQLAAGSSEHLNV